MSTIRVDNFGPSAGGTTYSARGIAKAWVNFDGTGTIAARDSLNLSSLTDRATGEYTVNFTNAFGAVDYATTASARASGTVVLNDGGAATASSIPLEVTNSSDVRTDASTATISSFGDLA